MVFKKSVLCHQDNFQCIYDRVIFSKSILLLLLFSVDSETLLRLDATDTAQTAVKLVVGRVRVPRDIAITIRLVFFSIANAVTCLHQSLRDSCLKPVKQFDFHDFH